MIAASVESEHDKKKKKGLAQMLNVTYNATSLTALSNNEVQYGALAQLVEQRTLNP
jgi:hypothetical protein